MDDGPLKIDDASKIVISLLEEMGRSCHSYLDPDNSIVVKSGERVLTIYSDKTLLKLYRVNGDPLKTESIPDIVDCTEIDLVDPQSINILKEWIGNLFNGSGE